MYLFIRLHCLDRMNTLCVWGDKPTRAVSEFQNAMRVTRSHDCGVISFIRSSNIVGKSRQVSSTSSCHIPAFCFVHVVSSLLDDKMSNKSWGHGACEGHLLFAYTGKTIMITGLGLGSRTFLVVNNI